MAGTYATAAAVIAISILFPVLGTIAVSLRFYTRIKAKSGLWVDDWLTVPALILEFVLAGLLIWGAATGSLGGILPPPNVPGPKGYLFSDSDQQIRLQQVQYFFDFICVFAFGLLKLSILFLYRRIFHTRVSRNAFDIITTAMIAVVVAWTLAFGLGSVLLCGTHPTIMWGPVAAIAQQCRAVLPFLEGTAISDFIIDVLIWTLPIPKIWALNMSTRRKLSVIAVFLVGLLTIAASATRMAIYIGKVVNAYADTDGETHVTILLFWTMNECGLGVIVACLPTLRTVYARVSPGSILGRIKSALSMLSLKSGSSGTEPSVHRLNSLEEGEVEHRSNLRAGQVKGTVATSYVVESRDPKGWAKFSGVTIRTNDENEL